MSDISTDPLWENYGHLALKYNLKACWSCPIIDSDNNVMAVFGMYYDYTKAPDTMDQMVIDRSTAILKVILENRQHARLIKETTMLMIQGRGAGQLWQLAVGY
ncbi:hypothetical protein HK413_02125 [Mucilaginibacter sp. S1162]|uniref:GAF domain-containing protein n=1 Tax=Mucilaginibacter humi TaxID=2732510 RepID=A0ABX1W0S9_9SPHI|nr:hypothetical protein [Mucilaginibacter humi]NNU33261.1 hypothetical protein [Mucilaginibacter humi]